MVLVIVFRKFLYADIGLSLSYRFQTLHDGDLQLKNLLRWRFCRYDLQAKFSVLYIDMHAHKAQSVRVDDMNLVQASNAIRHDMC
jgi:hypothetical protein